MSQSLGMAGLLLLGYFFPMWTLPSLASAGGPHIGLTKTFSHLHCSQKLSYPVPVFPVILQAPSQSSSKLLFFHPNSKCQFPRTWFILSSLFSLHTLSWSPSLLWLLSTSNMLTSLKYLPQPAQSTHSSALEINILN